MKKMALMAFMFAVYCTPVSSAGFPAVEVYRTASKAVVLIVAQKDTKSSMIGAGSIVSPSGYIVTSAHVIIDKNSSRPYSTIRVFVKPDSLTGDLQKDMVNRYSAKVIAYNNELDLAVLQVKGLVSDTGLIELANPEEIDVGEEVVAIGHPEQGGLWSLTYGRISGQIANQSDIKGKDVYQTDTSVNRGNSGGPLLDRRGYMVGINTNIARLGAGNMPITGVNFAVKSSVVKKWLADKGLLLAYGRKALYEESEASDVRTSDGPAEKKLKDDEVGKTVREPAKMQNDMTKTDVPLVEDVTLGNESQPEGKSVTPVEDGRESLQKNKDDLVREGETSMHREPEVIPKDKILTPKRPYRIDDLFEEVEKEMEDIMEEMRWKIREK